MSESYRIKIIPGQDQNIRINLNQKYETLDILSLKIRQNELYGSNCADYGVVVGRVFTNGGYGIPNARVSLFVPVDDLDLNNQVIQKLYPFRSIDDKNNDGYRYNLLPKRQQHSGHTPTGTFPSKQDILTDQNELQVFEKYYKYTAKTNNAGDFMITGVPVGTYLIHYDVDLSDIGCQSLVPFDMRYEGVSSEKFENDYTFMLSDNLSTLPQIVSVRKTVDVVPLWGDEDLCELGISRSDFDLETQGVRIEPYALFMGGTYTDDGRNGVKVRCNVDNEMGEKCTLTTTEGDIEAIRFTGFYDKDEDGGVNPRRPILERVTLDSTIDEDGNFFVRVPMNLKYMVTNEFGYLVESKDPNIGIPTEGKYRFRFSLNDDSGGRRTYRAKFLVPQIKEHQLNDGGDPDDIDPKSYSFSTNIDDYPNDAIDDIIGTYSPKQYPNDYFYGFRYNRVYTVSSFINQYYNQGVIENVFSFFTRNRNESFIGIKEIQPESGEDCSQTNQYFPITDAVTNNKFKFIIIILLSILEGVYLRVTQFLSDTIVEAIFDVGEAIYGIKFFGRRIFRGLAKRFRNLARRIQKAQFRKIGLLNYPDCTDCNGSDQNVEQEDTTFDFLITDDIARKIIAEGEEITKGKGWFFWDTGTVPYFESEWSGSSNAVIPRHDVLIPSYGVINNYGSNEISGFDGDDGKPSELRDEKTFLFEFKINSNGDKGYLLVGEGTPHLIARQDLIDDYNNYGDEENPGDPLDRLNIIGDINDLLNDGTDSKPYEDELSDYLIEDLTRSIQTIIIENNRDKLDQNEIDRSFFDLLTTQDNDKINEVKNIVQNILGLDNYEPGYGFIVDRIYLVSPASIRFSPEFTNDNETLESGCSKYDTIYDPNGRMRLKAYYIDGDDQNNSSSYQDLIANPDGYQRFEPYPDVFQEKGDDPCEPIDGKNIIVTISQYVDEKSNWEDDWGRRLAIAKHGRGTATGYSEFRNGTYYLVPAAGKNQALIGNYIRRKRLGKLLCAGYISYGFFNSWLNGSLYFFQFRRRNNRTRLFGKERRTNFCKDLIYRKVDENNQTHYYYRSTPYFNGEFQGLKKSYINPLETKNRSQKEILYPTTIMDMGPRNNFLNEICTDSDLDVNCSVTRSIGPTSYQSINDLMTYVLMSKEIKEKGSLDAPDLFDKRGRGSIDGDIAQLLNFNSQTGIWGYEDESEGSPYYPENGAFIYDGLGPVGINFLFSEDDPDTEIVEKNGAFVRYCINAPGQLSETSQIVPYYKWNKQGSGFGSIENGENQNWIKNVIFQTKYQGGWAYEGMLKFSPPEEFLQNIDDELINNTPFDFYFDMDNTTNTSFESYVLPPIRECGLDNYAPDSNGNHHIPLGGPFFFYFGLRNGKSSFDKFIKNFGPK